jgi:sialidase-1
MPFVCTNGSAHGDAGQCDACHACMLLSDDHGSTWYFGGYGQAGSRESQVAQIESNSSHAALYVTERNFGPKPGHRMYARSMDGGRTLSDFGIDAALPTPVTAHWTGIVASIIALPVSAHSNAKPNSQGAARAGASTPTQISLSQATEVLLYTAPADPTARRTLTVRVSHDQGHSWPGSKVIDAGPSGYSDLALIPSGVGIIFENGSGTFSDKVSFAAIPSEWLPL